MRLKKTPFALAVLALSGAGAIPLGAQTTSSPFSGTPIALPATFEASKFDKGGQNVAYKDLTAGNAGGQFRTTEDVDIIASSDAAGGPYAVNNFQSGEWLAYTVNVAEAKNYDLAIRASSNQTTPAAFHIEIDGVNVTGTIAVPKTASWTTFQSVGKQNIPLTAGKHVLKVVSEQQYFNISAISAVPSATQPSAGSYTGTPFTGTPVALPKAFYAKDFDKGGEGVAYHDLTAANTGGQYRTSEAVDIVASTDAQNGGFAINNFQSGEWVAYSVNVAEAKNYDLAIRASNNQTTPASFHIEVDGKDVTGSVTVPNTGGWNSFQWVGKQNIALTAGKHVIKVVSNQQYFNMGAISVLASAGQTTTPPAGTAPTVSLTAPTAGQTVSGTAVNYLASVNSAVTKVAFSVSSATPVDLGTKTAAPFGGTLDTTKLENGSHTLTAVASDATGKTSTASVTFNVQNGVVTQPSGTKPANLLFWSGFESGVSVGTPRSCYSSGCWQDLLGTDATTGFTWPPRIAGGGGAFQTRSGVASTPTTLASYMVNDIQTVTGRTGAPTRVLHSIIKQNSCTGTAPQGGCSTQDPYLLQPTSEPGDMYISLWRKYDPSLLQKVVNTWHVLFEWKTRGDYRISVNIATYGGTPYWQITADNNAGGGYPLQQFWRVNTTSVPVPIGQWFKFEVFWHRSKGSDGRVWMAVNGQKIVDKFGPNIGVNNDPINRIFLTQLYSGGSYPLEQWTDDVQIWSSFPSAKAGDPWYDGVYGPH